MYFVLVCHNIVISCIKYDENREYEYATLMDKIYSVAEKRMKYASYSKDANLRRRSQKSYDKRYRRGHYAYC